MIMPLKPSGLGIRRSITHAGLELVASMSFLVVAASCGGDGSGGRVQDGRVATLELEVRYREPFSYLSAIRELADGTILAADPTSQVLLRLDMDAGTADTIGRQGSGPQEYQGPDQVFALPGDSTLLVDLGNNRLTVVDPEGTFVEWTPMFRRTAGGRAGDLHPRFVDAAGNIYATAPHNVPGPPDTTAIHQIDRATWEETPVAWTWRPDYAAMSRAEKRPAMMQNDDWAVGADGSVAVVRVNGTCVDWYFPDGTLVRGPRTEFERFPVTRPEMDAYVDNMRANGVYVEALMGDGGVEGHRQVRGIPASALPAIDRFDWPEMLPVFRVGRTLISPQGEAWAERVMPAGRPAQVEVFDRTGWHLGSIELPASSSVVGFGSGSKPTAYVARMDELGQIWLERYRVQRKGV